MRTFTRVSDGAEMKLFTLASSENVWKYPGHQAAQATGVTWMMQRPEGGRANAPPIDFVPQESI
jgi:hypothetical protein